MIQEVVDTVTQVVASPDTVIQAVDTLKQTADSLAQAVGAQAGAQVTALVSLVLSIVLKFVIDLGKKLSVAFATAPDSVKAFAVVAFGQVVTLVSTKTGLVLQVDLSTLETTLSGLVIAGTAMGVHALSKIFLKKTV